MMRKIKIEGKSIDITYRTNSDMHTTEVIFDKKVQLGVDVYDVVGSNDICVIGNTDRRYEYLITATVITAEEYENIRDLWKPYDSYQYHSALIDLIRPEKEKGQRKSRQEGNLLDFLLNIEEME